MGELLPGADTFSLKISRIVSSAYVVKQGNKQLWWYTESTARL